MSEVKKAKAVRFQSSVCKKCGVICGDMSRLKNHYKVNPTHNPAYIIAQRRDRKKEVKEKNANVFAPIASNKKRKYVKKPEAVSGEVNYKMKLLTAIDNPQPILNYCPHCGTNLKHHHTANLMTEKGV